MTNRDHKGQHWIPSSYLAAWVDQTLPKRLGQRIYLYSAEGEYLKWTHPKRIFKVDDLYTRKGPEGERDLTTEHDLGRIEREFVRVRRGVLETRKELPPRDKAILAIFVAAMRNRSPREHGRINSFWKEVVRVGDNMKRHMESASKEERERLSRIPTIGGSERSFSLEVAREISEWPIGVTLPRSIAVEAPLLGKMNIGVLTIGADGPGLITSDSPVSWWAPPVAGRRFPRRLGLADRDIEITMPISPAQSLLFSHKPISDYAELGADGAVELNARTLAHCKEIWVANSPDLTVDWIDPDSCVDPA